MLLQPITRVAKHTCSKREAIQQSVESEWCELDVVKVEDGAHATKKGSLPLKLTLKSKASNTALKSVHAL